MELLCLGLNHRTAPVEVRERFAVGTNKLGAAAAEIAALADVPEGVVVSTCNRTEFYLAGENAHATLERLEQGLSAREKLEAEISEHFYRLEKADAARHLCRVVSGLDSMVLGETEIFGQVKQAYNAALEAGSTGSILNRLFQRAFSVGKKVRTETRIQEGSTSIGNVAVDLAEKIFGHLKDSQVMILGAGEMSRITAQSLVSRGARSIFVTNRSFERAEELARDMGGSAVRFDDWQRVLEQVDVVISSTGAPHAIIKRADVEMVRRARKFRPLFFIDIAVPRDIDPAVAEIDEVYLYDIDTLEQLAEEARTRRQRQITECERIIDLELKKLNLPGT
ncbi:glutamyl-tRNA reductase [Luteolibacter pohnpeiensis]|uniref:Glutamyl-tRNA reductase n=1 Tax=Luteolibacter pohnpeiensis TaxID=454153 RepID=A0A934S7S6_9BACT|nr:glutamyl-tRNA reductase [Luteolibacter pohnpeiensis]MBK1883408.1 glutamyl-tRNA reductase [Luteolibacter pohnpeiensis]